MARKAKTKDKDTGKALVPGKKKTLTRAEKVREEINKIKIQTVSNYLRLAELLYEVREKQYYIDYGYNSFREYAELDLGTKERKAQYLIDIWRKAKQLKLPEERLLQIGWTKTKEIVREMTEENVDELLDVAEKNPTPAVVQFIRERRGESVGTTQKIGEVRMSLRMSPDEADVILNAIESAKKEIDTENTVTALEMICMTYLQEHEDATAPTLDSLIAYAKNIFMVDLVPADTVEQKEKKRQTKPKSEEVEGGKEGPVAEDDLEVTLRSMTKAQLREYIQKEGLGIKIARGASVDDIVDEILAAQATDPGFDDGEEEIDINAMLGIK